MAYMNKETTAKIRAALKAEFGKTVKFSVTMRDYSHVTVAVMESHFFGDEYFQVNHYWIDTNYQDMPDQKTFLKKVDQIIRDTGDYYNNSDVMTDYFDVAFYYTIQVGKWNKTHKKI